MLLSLDLLKKAAKAWSEDKASMMGAALSYYTLFSIVPILIIAITVTSLFVGGEAARSEIFQSIQGFMGENARKAIEEMVRQAGRRSSGMVAIAVSVLTLVLGATGAVAELRNDLNLIWHVKPPPATNTILSLVRRRLLSLVMVLGLAGLFLMLIISSTFLGALENIVSQFIPQSILLWNLLYPLASFFIFTLAFAAVLKFVPNVKLKWSDVWGGRHLNNSSFSFRKIFDRALFIAQRDFCLRHGKLACGHYGLDLLLGADLVFWGGIFEDLRAVVRVIARCADAEFVRVTTTPRARQDSNLRPLDS